MNQLLQSFKDRPTAAAYERLNEFLLTAAQAQIDQWALDALTSIPDGGTFLDQTWSHVSREGMGRAVERGLALLESGSASEAAQSALAYASLQFPSDLQPHLSRLFRLKPNAASYYENWPWRGASAADLPFLLPMLTSAHTDVRHKAWHCLLETRHPEALTAAVTASPGARLTYPAEAQLLEVGYRSPRERLYPAACAHMSFPAGYFQDEGAAWKRRSVHPTWRLPTDDSPQFRFGGEGCGGCKLCGQALHHLVSLPASMVFDGDTPSSTVALEVCLSCLGWERGTLSYRHAAEGRIEGLDTGTTQPEFVAGPLRETQIRLVSTPDRWMWQDWGLANGRENLHRVGGHPSWIQSAAFPDCLSCGTTMQFLLQLDSEIPTADGQEWLWGSGGICYSFQCSPCRVTTHLWQCT